MDCGMVGDVHPKEMIIDNISFQQCNEVYTVIKLPASTSSKGTTSVHVKIDTRSGGNILPLSVPTAASETNQPRWPAHWPEPHMNQANHLQWVSNSPVQNPLWHHPLATKYSWSPTMHDPLILVHCRHTWSCSLGYPSMWEVSCGPSELCCQDHSTR